MSEQDPDCFDRPAIRQRLWWLLLIACGLSVIAGFFVHRHPYFSFELWPAFHGLFGLLAFVVIVLVARLFQWLARRDGDYYRDGGAP